jgi:hypothetical protein
VATLFLGKFGKGIMMTYGIFILIWGYISGCYGFMEKISEAVSSFWTLPLHIKIKKKN